MWNGGSSIIGCGEYTDPGYYIGFLSMKVVEEKKEQTELPFE